MIQILINTSFVSYLIRVWISKEGKVIGLIPGGQQREIGIVNAEINERIIQGKQNLNNLFKRELNSEIVFFKLVLSLGLRVVSLTLHLPYYTNIKYKILKNS